MPSWSEILKEVQQYSDPGKVLFEKRKEYFSKIKNKTGRNVIAYYSGWLKKADAPQVSISDLDKNAFMSAVYGMDKSLGLDLILHTPGGDLAATESIVDYLKSVFNKDIRAFIPQISMSAGTMIALSCKEIIMGKQSSLGPIDPQMGGIACQAVLDEFEKATKDIESNPATLGLWQTIIGKYHPTFLTACDNAIRWSAELAEKWLNEVDPNIEVERVKDLFLNHKNSYSHSRHISKEECKSVGLNIVDLECDQELQDAVLSLHHCYTIYIDMSQTSKIVENHSGGAYVQSY